MSPKSAKTSAEGRKGQIYVIDFVISISIFLLLLVVVYSTWVSNVESAGEDLENRQAASAASFVLTSIIDYSGDPSGWAANASDPSASWIKGIGCAGRPGYLDPARLSLANAFFNDSTMHNNTRWKLGFGQFDGDIRIQNSSNATVYTFGTPPNSSVVVLYSASRLAFLSGQQAWVRVRIWKGAIQ